MPALLWSVVGHHQQCAFMGVRLLDKQVDHVLLVVLVQVAGGFVRQQQFRPVQECTAHRHPLPFAVRQVRRPLARLAGQPDRGQQFHRTLPGGRVHRSGRIDETGQQDIFQHTEICEQFKCLEHLSDLADPEAPAAGFRQAVHAGIADEYFTLRRQQRARKEVQKRGFAGPGRAHDGHAVTGLDPKFRNGKTELAGSEIVELEITDVDTAHRALLRAVPLRGFQGRSVSRHPPRRPP
jgi:hypothetical protein